MKSKSKNKRANRESKARTTLHLAEFVGEDQDSGSSSFDMDYTHPTFHQAYDTSISHPHPVTMNAAGSSVVHPFADGTAGVDPSRGYLLPMNRSDIIST